METEEKARDEGEEWTSEGNKKKRKKNGWKKQIKIGNKMKN